ncbi:hypothetical protein [Paenibacillus eucommiae]|uniref:Uncharacterized protein n=1 Tax=Paenibacillus eucommiae TaxID=1355755 RepID=A0ABS4JCU7_9BACL|nr:hypothetical protein [Paenibacillus eucommiae]MBP1996554.1 hypothetical protein [Paenibacillus eucommiae]
MKRVLTLMLLTFVVITGCKYNSVNKVIEHAVEHSYSPVTAENLAKGKPDQDAD